MRNPLPIDLTVKAPFKFTFDYFFLRAVFLPPTLPVVLLEKLSILSDLNRKFGRAGLRSLETKWSFYGGGIRHNKWWAFLSYNPKNGPRMMEVQKLLRKCFIDEVRGYLCIC